MRREGLRGGTIPLEIRFYNDDVLFNPYSIDSVKVYDAPDGGNLIVTLSPVSVSVGVYRASWAIPSSTTLGIYYDEWVWTAAEGMDSTTDRHAFEVTSSYSSSSSITTDLNQTTELRLRTIETAINSLQTALNNVATRREIRNLIGVLSQQVSELETRITEVENQVTILQGYHSS